MSLLRSFLRTNLPSISARGIYTGPTPAPSTQPIPDRLFKEVALELRGHDPEVLKSYTTFLSTVCKHMEVRMSDIEKPRYVRWIQWMLRSKFVHKKYKLHYETRTYIRRVSLYEMTGSTASTVLEYLQRNIPEGVGFKATYHEVRELPASITTPTTSQ